MRSSPPFQIIEVRVHVVDASRSGSDNIIPAKAYPDAVLFHIIVTRNHFDRAVIDAHSSVRLGDAPPGFNRESSCLFEMEVYYAGINGLFGQQTVTIEARPSVQTADAWFSREKHFDVIDKRLARTRLLSRPSFVLFFNPLLLGLRWANGFGLSAAYESASGKEEKARPHASSLS